MLETIQNFLSTTGIAKLFGSGDGVAIAQTLIMWCIIGVLIYLAIVKQFEPLLLLPIAIGMLLANLPGAELIHMDLFIHEDGSDFVMQQVIEEGGLIDILYLGVKLGIYPSLIFMGVGAMTDFSPLIANPKTLLLGAAAQFGVFFAFIGALLLGFAPNEAASIGIIGGADGPTAILVTKTLAPTLLGAIGARALRRYRLLVPIPTILANAAIIPPVLIYVYGVPDAYPFILFTVTLGEVLSVYALGLPLLYALEKRGKGLFTK